MAWRGPFTSSSWTATNLLSPKIQARYLQVREEEVDVAIEGQAADAFLDMDFMERGRGRECLELAKGT